MALSSRAHRRETTRPSLRRATQCIDPTVKRKGLLANPGSLLLTVCAVAFVAYVFNLGNLGKTAGVLLERLDAWVRSYNGEVAAKVIGLLPYVLVAVGALALYFVLNMMGQALRRIFRPRRGKAPLVAAGLSRPISQGSEPLMIRPARLTGREMDMKPSGTTASTDTPIVN
jgi:hypothetical protein